MLAPFRAAVLAAVAEHCERLLFQFGTEAGDSAIAERITKWMPRRWSDDVLPGGVRLSSREPY